MEARARSGAGRNLFLTFFVSEASEWYGDGDPSEIQSVFLARKGERGMKDTDHFLTGVPFTSAVNGSIEEH
jgi:hypothetical protein